MVKKWEVEYSAEFGAWWDSLEEDVQESIAHDIEVLAAIGPGLGRPLVDTIRLSRHANMKELRTHHNGHPYRTFFAFDPRRTAVLLIAGDKTGNRRFYDEYVPKADQIYEQHLAALRKRGIIR